MKLRYKLRHIVYVTIWILNTKKRDIARPRWGKKEKRKIMIIIRKIIVNIQLTLHLCKLVLEFQELSDSDNWQCYLIISLHSYLQICKGTKIVISILFAFECWPAFSYKSYQIRFVFLAKLNSPLVQESSDYPCNHKTNILKHIKAWFLFISPTPMSDQDRISPYNINTISSRQVMRIKKNIS